MGLIPESILDTILTPLLRTRFKLGLLDPTSAVPFSTIGPEVVNCPEHQALAYEAAVKSIVLLQNKNNILPLNRDSISNILVAGPTSADVQAMVGNYNGWSENIVTFLEGITGAVDVGTVVDYTIGCQMNTPGGYYGFWEAQMADVVIVCLGNSKMMEGEEGEAILNPDGGDRTDIRLPESQREYIRLLREKLPEKKIVAVITGGSAIAMQDVLDAADAVLMTWYPGEQGGKALADILFGTVNPSGKLPITIYRSTDDLPPFDDYSMQGRTYKFFKGQPLFPFGYGLSYSLFEYNFFETGKKLYQEQETIKCAVTLVNKGKMSGEEVVLVFASKTSGPNNKCLVGFKKVKLEPFETKSISLDINLLDMYQWSDIEKKYYVEPGKYYLEVKDYLGKGSLKVEIEVN
jgi:beta-glucosidase